MINYKPGGLELTRRALSLCSVPYGGRIVVIGCGRGDVVKYLSENEGFVAIGIDPDKDVVDAAKKYYPKGRFIVADPAYIPLADTSVDCIMMETMHAKTHLPEDVLLECARIMPMSGSLIVSDIYTKYKHLETEGLLGRIECKETVTKRLEKCGFEIDIWEDHIDILRQTAAKWGRELSTEEFYKIIGIEEASLKKGDFSYFLAIARRQLLL